MSDRLLRKTWVTAAGFALILLGIALLVLPGPGLLVIAAGLALLATEFTWAERLLKPLRRRINMVMPRRSSKVKPPSE